MTPTHNSSSADQYQDAATDANPEHAQSDQGAETLIVSPIVKALEKYMLDHALTMKELSDPHHLDMAYSTLSSAMRGARAFPSDRDTRNRVARLLGMPGLQVAIWCELLSHEDFIVKDDFQRDAAMALEAMRADPAVAHFVPSDEDWKQMPRSGQIALVLMYQTLVGRRFLRAAKVAEGTSEAA